MTHNPPVNVAHVGLGNFAQGLVSSIKAAGNLRLVACHDADPRKTQSYADARHCQPKETYEAVLDDPAIDAVIITTPNHLHCEQVIQAARRGKHVFVEKPIANRVADARRMTAACAEANRVLAVGHNTRRLAGFRKIKQLLAEGHLGDVVFVDAQMSSFGDVRPGAWRWYNDKCPGGPLMQLGIHFIDAMTYLLGPVQRVCAVFDGRHTASETPDFTTLIGRLACGATFSLTHSYVIWQETRFGIFGTQRNALALGMHLDQRLISQEVQPNFVLKDTDIPLVFVDSFQEELREFADCILQGRSPEVGGTEAAAALAVVEGAIRSADTGEWVTLQGS